MRNYKDIVESILISAMGAALLISGAIHTLKYPWGWLIAIIVFTAFIYIIISKFRRRGLCAFCEKIIPTEEAYCNDKCLHAHVNQTWIADEATKKSFPHPSKHGKFCCCIYC